MPFTQETFLNTSITGFTGSVGWGSQSSRLSVKLVEDLKNGDNFTAQPVGSPIYFDYQTWRFGGIIQSYTEDKGNSGNSIYSVELEDPRELLSGVQLILQDYSGVTYDIPNLYNIYGYLEAKYGFGGSQVNGTGMPWYNVVSALSELQKTTPINFRGYNYICMPFFGMSTLLPSYYRVGGGTISLMDFINDICDARGYDYYISMSPVAMTYPATGYYGIAANYIIVNMVDRSKLLRTGVIDEFVGQVDGAVSKKRGYELRNDVTSKFLIGAKINSILFQEQDNTKDNNEEDGTYADDIILPYWGYDCFDNLIIGEGNFYDLTGVNYRFRLDGRPLYAQTGISFLVNYKTDLAEIFAALDGQDAWMSFLDLMNRIPSSPHFGKATALQISSKINPVIATILKSGKPLDRRAAKVLLASNRSSLVGIANDRLENNIDIVYNYVKDFATEYYGKKFMVRIPSVEASYEKDKVDEPEDLLERNRGNVLTYSLEPTDTGYIAESYWGIAASNGYMPYNVEKFLNNKNKIYAYGRFINNQKIRSDFFREFYPIESIFNWSEIPYDSYILEQYPNLSAGKMRENMFVKGRLEENLVFLKKNTLYSPRVVFTLDAPVLYNAIGYTKNRQLLQEILKVYFAIDEEGTFDRKGTIGKSIDKLEDEFGADHLWHNRKALAAIPDLVAAPMLNNKLRYGPWYKSNKAGKVNVEIDDTLNPWGYGGYTALNYAGSATVEEDSSKQQVSETGSIEFPGVPSISLGSQLLSGGPTVTDISVDIAEGGATTTYKMQTWKQQIGKLNKYNVDRFKKLSQLSQKQRKALRELYMPSAPITITAHEHKELYRKYRSSHLLLAGELIHSSGDNTYLPNVALGSYELLETVDNDTYPGKAGMSLDALYTPYTTIPSGTEYHNFPYFEEPTDVASSPTVNDLNPFDGIAIAFPESSGLPKDLSNESTDVRALALKSPLVIGGWGFDVDGNPVPGNSGEFIDNYKKRADKWKIGPLDIRWDDDRKVWNASGGSGGGSAPTKTGKLRESLLQGDTASVEIWEYNANSGQEIETSEYENARDWLLPDNTYLPTNTKVFISRLNNVWYVIAAAPPC